MTRTESHHGEGTGALDKALDVLDLVAASAEGMAQTDIADRLAIPRTTSYRLLATLVKRGLLRRDALRKVYCLGFRCFEMARQAHASPDLAAACLVEMRALRDLTGETCYLGVLDGLEVLSLERCDGAHSHRSAAVLGQRKPLYCTSQGKAILSRLDAPRRDALLQSLVLRPLTASTITDRRRLLAELRLTQARGYAIDDEEILDQVRCVGAPVIDGQGRVRGAISIAAPAYRMTRERLDLLGPEVAEAALRAGAQLRDEPQAPQASAARPLDGPWAFHGAFPLWCEQRQALHWADVLAPSVRRFDARGDHQLLTLESPVLGLVQHAGGLAVVHEGGVVTLGMEGNHRAASGSSVPGPGSRVGQARGVAADRDGLPPTWSLPGLQSICNGPEGGLWAAVATPDSGTVVGVVQPDGRLDVRWRSREPLQCLRWRASDQCFYATAPASGSILRLQPGSSALRRLASVLKGSGQLSGLAFDRDDGIWTALRNGWSVVRFSLDGALDRVIGLPVPSPTDLAVGGARMDRLYVTSARHSVALDALASAPLSGQLFELDL